MNEIDLELIERYQNGLLSEKELSDFRQRRKEDKTFDNRIKILEELEHMHHIDSDSFRQEIKSIANEHSSVSKPKKQVWFLLGLAFLGAIISAHFFFNRDTVEPSTDQLYASVFESYPNIITDRGLDDGQEILNLAMTAYDKQDYMKAKDYFKSINNELVSDTTSFYLSICHMKLGESNLAQPILKQLANSKSSSFNAPASWYYALTYLQQGNISEAKNQLNTIIDHKQSKAYVKKAKELLSKL